MALAWGLELRKVLWIKEALGVCGDATFSLSNGFCCLKALSCRRRLSEQLAHTPTSFKRDPEDPSAVALKEPWQEKVR